MAINPRDYFISVPQTGGAMDVYRDYMSLRDLMDQRRVRDLQVRKLQLQEEKDAREEAERQAFRNVLMTANPTDQQLIQANPELAWKYITSRATGQKEERAAAKAGTEATEADTARRRALNQQIADIGMEAVKIKDPAQREEFFNTQMAGTLIDRGFTPAQEFGGFRVPADERQAQFAYGSAYGAEKLRDFLDKQAKAAHEAKMNPLQLANQQAVTARAQQVLTGQALSSPAAAPALFEGWYKGWLLRNNTADSPENRSLGIEAYNRQIHPQFDQPGVDVPKPQAVINQEVEKAAAIAKVQADAAKKAAGEKPMSAEASKVLAVANSLVPQLTKLRAAIQSGGRQAIIGMITGSDPVLTRIFEDTADLKGRLRSGGAMNKDETENFKKSFGRPSDVIWGTSGALAAIESALEEAQHVEGYIKPGGSPAGGDGQVQKWGRDANGNPVRIP